GSHETTAGDRRPFRLLASSAPAPRRDSGSNPGNTLIAPAQPTPASPPEPREVRRAGAQVPPESSIARCDALPPLLRHPLFLDREECARGPAGTALPVSNRAP